MEHDDRAEIIKVKRVGRHFINRHRVVHALVSLDFFVHCVPPDYTTILPDERLTVNIHGDIFIQTPE